MKLKIGITFSETNYQNYPKWILASNENIEIVELNYVKNNLLEAKICEGIIFTGGVDIMPIDINYENAPKQFNKVRDNFEKEVLKISLENKIPILGICRGLQLINLFFGGDLILDMAELNQTHKNAGTDKMHSVIVEKKSKLNEIVGCVTGEINSAHHQCIAQLGKNLKISATASDETIEAIEFQNNADQYLIAVQWHPERMDANSKFSKNIKESFIKAAQKQF